MKLLSRSTRLLGVASVVALALGLLLAPGASAAVAPPTAAEEVAAQESVASEVAEEAAEAREEAAAAPEDLAAAKGYPGYLRKVERFKTVIARIRAHRLKLRSLPISSTQRKVHLPIKRALGKEYRQRLRELRARFKAKQH
jgi:hypothetical protein